MTTITAQVQGSPIAVAEELEAAELEQLVPINADQLVRAKRYAKLRDRKTEIEAEMETLKKGFKAELELEGVRGLLYRGKTFVARKTVMKPYLDAKRLKVEEPEIAARYSGIRPEIHLVVS